MTTTLADVLYSGAHAPGGEPQSPPSDLTPSSPTGSSPGSDDGDGASRKRSASGSLKEGKERTANKICRVCGDKAYSYNFNVITCESCKAFFRRNANKEKEIRCPFNESCEINVVSRRFCQRCRLFKCFQVGMKKEWIMTDEARLEKKARVEENRERRREEAKKKDDGTPYHHYRTNSQSSGSGSAKSSSAVATVAAAAAAVAESTANLMQHQQQQQQQQQQLQQQQQQVMFQPELPTMSTSTATTNLLDALAQQVHQQQVQLQQQQPAPVAMPQAFQAATLPAAATAALVAAVAAPQQPSNSELVAHAIALEQQLQQTPFAPAAQQPSAATAAAAYQAASLQAAVANHHHQQQMAATNAALQQVLSMTATPVQTPTLCDATMAAAMAGLQQPATPTTASAVAAAINAAAATASPLGPLTQAALIMDASAAATQQLLSATAPPSALAAVASTMLMPPQQQHSLLQPTLPERCCCTCNCGKYHGARSIVEQAQEEWEAERRARRSNSSNFDNGPNMGLAELLPTAASSVNWLNPATNSNPLTDGSSFSTLMPPSMSVDEAYPDLHSAKESFLKNPHLPGAGIRDCHDPEFGPLQAEDEKCLKAVCEANKVWTDPLGQEEDKLHSQHMPTKNVMLQMMVGAVNRMIKMAKKFPELKQLHATDQLKLIKSCYLDVMIIRGAMAYDPSENAWKGPTKDHSYKIKMDAMNDDPTTDNMFHQSIRLYAMFKEEYRQDLSIMLLLNMIILFDPNAENLTNVAAVRAEQNKYKKCLKRYMYTLLGSHQSRAQLEYKTLLDRLAIVRKMNTGARGIMVEHADQMDPLLKELLGKDDDKPGSNKPSSKKHSPSGVSGVSSVSSTASIDEQPTTSAGSWPTE